jgi:hypothetical protein
VPTPKDAVAVWLAAPGSTTLNAAPGQPDSGTIVALNNVASFGSRQVDANGDFMDFDGADEPNGPDFNTRGMLVKAGEGIVLKRYYANVYPALTVTGTLGPANPVTYPRPLGASKSRVPLIPALKKCVDPNTDHGQPLDERSCSPASPSSDTLTVGSVPVKFLGSAALSVIAGNTGTTDDEADVAIDVSAIDVRCTQASSACPNGAGSDYGGKLLGAFNLRLTDRSNNPSASAAGTLSDFRFEVPFDCSTTPGDSTIGSACNSTTSADALLPGAVIEGKRALWELGQIEVLDAGPNGTGYGSGCPLDCGDGDEQVFLREGIFAP